ncbi:hypothetical protein GF312_17315, partial [Candidatus Poribacteria bacterium]|nr:hypothetical protein [Candidatus Poribacteria bacterium]
MFYTALCNANNKTSKSVRELDKTMAVITISRQLGSAGDYIANLVSSMLSYRLVTKESMVRELTRRNVMDAETAREIGEGKPGIFDRFMKNKSKSIYAIRDLIHEAANEDDSVILGRGANLELKEHPSLLRVRVIANLEVRIR